MNAILEAIYRTGQVIGPDEQPIPLGRSGITYDSGRLLYELVREHRPKKTLEVGLAYGLSALFICQAHEENGLDGHHTAIDPDETRRWQQIGLLNLERAGLRQRLTLHEAPSYAALPELCASGEAGYDFAFIDGNHLFDYALLDFFYVDLLLDVGGLVAIDDLWMPSVQKMVRYALSNRQYKLETLPAVGSPSPLKTVKTLLTRLRRNPVDFSWRVIRQPHNLVALRKRAHDQRDWTDHRRF